MAKQFVPERKFILLIKLFSVYSNIFQLLAKKHNELI